MSINVTRFLGVATLILRILLPISPTVLQGQTTFYDDSTAFDAASTGRLREIDFEDCYSLTLQRITIRNPWGLVAEGYADSTQADGINTTLLIAQGATIDFPARTRTVSLESFTSYAHPVDVYVTDFNDSAYMVPKLTFPMTVSSVAGIKRLQFMGYDEFGLDINWRTSLWAMTTFNDVGDTLVFTDFEELVPDRSYVYNRAIETLEFDPRLYDTLAIHGMTVYEPTLGVAGTWLGLGEARIDADNPIGNLALVMAPGGTLDFPQGTEGVMLVVEPFNPGDSFTLQVTGWDDSVWTVTATSNDSVAFIGASSPAGIRQIAPLVGLTNTWYFEGTVPITTVLVAEMPQNEIASIEEVITDLDTIGVLGGAESAALHRRLDGSIEAANGADSAAAIAGIHAFVDDVAGLFSSGVLVPEEARPLIDKSNYIATRLLFQRASVAGEERSTTTGLRTTSVQSLNDGVMIGYRLDRAEHLRLTVADLRGEVVRSIDLGARDGGAGEVRWDMTNNAGEKVPNGLYLYVIEGKQGKVSGRFFVIQK